MFPTLIPREFCYAGMAVRVLADQASDDGRIAVCACTAPPGAAIPLHRHTREDEIVLVHEGAVRVWRHGTATRTLGPGESLLLPRDVPHRLAVASPESAGFLLLWSPAGFEEALAAAGTPEPGHAADPDDVAALFAGAGVWMVPDPGPVAAARSTLAGRDGAAPDPRT